MVGKNAIRSYCLQLCFRMATYLNTLNDRFILPIHALLLVKHTSFPSVLTHFLDTSIYRQQYPTFIHTSIITIRRWQMTTIGKKLLNFQWFFHVVELLPQCHITFEPILRLLLIVVCKVKKYFRNVSRKVCKWYLFYRKKFVSSNRLCVICPEKQLRRCLAFFSLSL